MPATPTPDPILPADDWLTPAQADQVRARLALRGPVCLRLLPSPLLDLLTQPSHTAPVRAPTADKGGRRE